MGNARSSNEPGALNPGFTTNAAAIPGMKIGAVAHEVRTKTRANMAKTPDAWKEYEKLSRTIRIVNRAEKGPCKGQPFMGVFSAEAWPEEADGLDTSTWLQPGEYMDVPKDVALHLVGNVWDPSLPDKQAIIGRYGGPQFKPPPGDVVSGRGASMQVIGPPAIPDLIVVEVTNRGRMSEEYKYVYELYTRGLVGSEVKIGEDAMHEEAEAVLTTVR